MLISESVDELDFAFERSVKMHAAGLKKLKVALRQKILKENYENTAAYVQQGLDGLYLLAAGMVPD